MQAFSCLFQQSLSSSSSLLLHSVIVGERPMHALCALQTQWRSGKSLPCSDFWSELHKITSLKDMMVTKGAHPCISHNKNKKDKKIEKDLGPTPQRAVALAPYIPTPPPAPFPVTHTIHAL